MERSEFTKVAETFIDQCMETIRAKGRDYAGDEDALANFKRNAERLGLTKYQIWHVYFAKHLDAVSNSIKHNPKTPDAASEPLSCRLMDIINYALLMHAMLVEDKQNAKEA